MVDKSVEVFKTNRGVSRGIGSNDLLNSALGNGFYKTGISIYLKCQLQDKSAELCSTSIVSFLACQSFSQETGGAAMHRWSLASIFGQSTVFSLIERFYKTRYCLVYILSTSLPFLSISGLLNSASRKVLYMESSSLIISQEELFTVFISLILQF